MSEEKNTPQKENALYKGLVFLFLKFPFLALWFVIFSAIIARMFENYSESYKDLDSLFRFIIQTGMDNTNFLIMFSAFVIMLLLDHYKTN